MSVRQLPNLGRSRVPSEQPRLLLRLALYAGAVVIAAAAAALWVTHRTVTAEAHEAVLTDARFLADRLGRDDLARSAVASVARPDVVPQLDELFAGAVTPGVTTVTLIARSGRITYSTDHTRIGRLTDRPEHTARALEDVGAYGRAERGGMTVSEAYVPIHSFLSDKTFAAGVLAVERDHAPVAREIRHDFLLQASSVALALLVLYAALFPIMRRLTRQLEARSRLLAEHTKSEAVAGLARGIAHDFNNLLTGIAIYSDLLQDRLDPHDSLQREVEEIKKASARGAALTRQLLTFGSDEQSRPDLVHPNAVLGNAEELLRRLLGENVELTVDADPAAGHVYVDARELEQALVNLAIAARQTMPSGGRLHLSSRASAGDVELTVADTGFGYDRSQLAQLFEGSHASFSLASVRETIRCAGGTVSAASTPGAGTTVTITLPARAPAEPAHAPRAVEQPAKRRTALLVEDEEIVRAVVREILENDGFTVVAAHHGRHALELSDAHAGPIDVLITDVVMPELGGPELAEELLRRRPDLRVVYTSGYPADAVAVGAGAAFLQKPFAHAALRDKVHQVLAAPVADAA